MLRTMASQARGERLGIRFGPAAEALACLTRRSTRCVTRHARAHAHRGDLPGAAVASTVLLLCGCGAGRATTQTGAMAAPAGSAAAVPPADVGPAGPPDPTAMTDWKRECFRTPIRVYRGEQQAPMDRVELQRLEQCPAPRTRLECELVRARAYVEHRRWERAAPLLRRIALDPGSGNLGLDAARLYFDSLDQLGSNTDPVRPACYSIMAADVDRILAIRCAGQGDRRSERCRWLRRIDDDFEWMGAERLVDRGCYLRDQNGQSSAEARALLVEGGDRLVALFDRGCRGLQPEDPDRYFRCDEVIYGAFRAYHFAGARDEAEAARAALLDPANGLTSSPLAERARQGEPP